MEKINIEQKRIWVLGLLIECPFGKALDDCPANDARSLPVSERTSLVFSMNKYQLDEIIGHHLNCLREREK